MPAKNILVADDDSVTRRLLQELLEKAGYSVQIFDNGAAALSGLLQPEAPHIAVIDWMMPGLNGPDVCAKLRAANLKIRPHVIMLSAKTDKAELAAALDAGADDFLSKPFNHLELLARLRVAARTIRSQLELHQQISKLETLTQRYQLLGEIVAGQCSTPPVEVTGAAPAAAANPPGGSLCDELNAVMRQTLVDLGQGNVISAPAAADPGDQSPQYLAWAGLIFAGPHLWIDLLLEGDPAGIVNLYETLLRRAPASDNDVLRFFAEKHTILSSALKASLQSEKNPVLAPLLTRALRVDSYTPPRPQPAGEDTVVFTLVDYSLRLRAKIQPSPISFKEPGQLNPNDILAEAFPPPAVSSIPFLNQGAVLHERYIDKITAFTDTEFADLKVSVYKPTALAVYFNKFDALAGHGGGI